jgi:acetyl/propionyl-CoA carboxylase alpha subunit
VLRRALDETWVPGVITNREHLARILAHPGFLAGELDTHFLERHAGELAARPPGLDRIRVAAIAATLAGIGKRGSPDAYAVPGWRNVPFVDQQVHYKLSDTDVLLGYHPEGGALVFSIGGKTTTVSRVRFDPDDHVAFVEHGGHRRRVRVTTSGDRIYVLAEGITYTFVEQPRFPDHAHQAVAGGLVAPMPGKVVKVLVAEGQEVAAGSALVVLEAMKMEHTVRAADGGVVRALHVTVGDQVDTDHLLAVVTA